uniref:Reverse transcriptase domain-containing protein n=1 Tax=Aegilops tauschii subsp. strangulata TaxID=200361 RepID=A0A453RVA6_AEGTS
MAGVLRQVVQWGKMKALPLNWTTPLMVPTLPLNWTTPLMIPALPLNWTTPLMIPAGVLCGESRSLEVKEALKRVKGGKAMGPDCIPIEVWRGLRDIAIVWLTKLFNLIFRADKMLE